MKTIITICMICVATCLSYSCSHGEKGSEMSATKVDTLVSPKYATGYEVKDSGDIRLVDVGKGYHFALVATDEVSVPDPAAGQGRSHREDRHGGQLRY